MCEARRPSLSCGDVVTQDVKLQASLMGCTTGLVVGASGVTIDLNGFTIGGAGPELASTGIEAVGVSDVSVRNGRIVGFATAVSLSGVSGSRVSDLRIVGVDTGIRLFGPEDATKTVIADNTVLGSTSGIVVFGAGDAIGNRIVQAADDGTPWSETSPVGVGIYCRGSSFTSNLVRGNSVMGGSVGISLFFCGADLVANEVTGSRLDGIRRERSNGLIERNRSSGNGATGITSSDSHGLFHRNTTNANGGHGLVIVDQLPDHGPFHTVTGNVANSNGGAGIFTALTGVVDGGRNRAHANGDPAQCVGVVCT